MRPVPPYTFFTDSVIKVLGLRTQMTPNVVVPLDDGLRAEILVDVGVDPLNLPAEWLRTLKDRPNGLHARLNQAYRFLHHVTHRGRHGRAHGLSGGRGQWGLTELGVIEARRLVACAGGLQQPVVESPLALAPPLLVEEVPSPLPVEEVPPPPVEVVETKPQKTERNTTARWLERHLRPKNGVESVLMRMIKHSIRRKCRISAEAGLVDDHVNEYLCRLIRRDALRKKIEEGVEITYTHIASYAVRSAITDIRDSSTNPITRELLGARTDKERRNKKDAPSNDIVFTNSVSSNIVVHKLDVGTEVFDIVDTSAGCEETLSDRLRFEQVWSRIEGVMAGTKSSSSDRYLNLFRMQVEQGYSVKEIARLSDISPNRVAAMLQEARNILRGAGRDLFAP